ncbi:hypothetical protein D3C80_1719890 [compost metagenome]
MLGDVDSLTCQHDEAGDVLLLIGQIVLQHLQAIQCPAGFAAQRCGFWRVQFGDFFHRCGSAFTIFDFPVRITINELAALLERLRVAIHGFNLGKIGIAGYQDAVIDRVG